MFCLIDCIGVVVMKGINSNREEIYDISTSFNESTKWYTDLLPTSNKTNCIEQGLDWISVMSAVGSFSKKWFIE